MTDWGKRTNQFDTIKENFLSDLMIHENCELQSPLKLKIFLKMKLCGDTVNGTF